METKKRLLKSIQYELELNVNIAFQEKTIISKAQKFTGLKTKGLKTLLKSIQKIKNKEIKDFETKKAKSFNMSRTEYLKLYEKSKNILRDFSTGYSMGEMKHIFLNDKRFCTLDATKEYAKSYKYKANHGRLSLKLTKKDLRSIKKIETVWTVRLENGKAKWIEESGKKKFHEIKFVKGYCIGNSHAETKTEALRLESCKRKNAKKTYNDNEFIGLEQIKELGACDVGINSFCQKYNLKKDYGYQLGYLKSIGIEGSNYFNKLSK
jgi:hypothetical protein